MRALVYLWVFAAAAAAVEFSSGAGVSVRAHSQDEGVQVLRGAVWASTAGSFTDTADGDYTVRTIDLAANDATWVFQVSAPGSFAVENLTRGVLENVAVDGNTVTCETVSGAQGKAGRLLVTTPGGGRRVISNILEPATASEEARRALDHTAGSLHEALHDALATKASTWTVTNSQYYTTVGSLGSPVNAACWVGTTNDLRAVAMDSSESGFFGRKAGVLVTPQHVVNAAHFRYKVGTTLYFHGGQSATINSSAMVDSGRWQDCDICLYTLDAPIASPIEPMKIPSEVGARIRIRYNGADNYGYPENYGALCFAFAENSRRVYPLLLRDVTARVNAIEVGGVDLTSDHFNANFSQIRPAFGIAPSGWSAGEMGGPTSGDSGHPVMVEHGGETVLWAVMTSTTQGPCFAGSKELVDALILKADAAAGVSTGYTATEYSFSSFPEHP